jgi:hypothetical protein
MANIELRRARWLLVAATSLVGCTPSAKNDAATRHGERDVSTAMHTSDARRENSIDVELAPDATSAAEASSTPAEPIADRLKTAGLEVSETTQFLDALKSQMAERNRAAVCALASYPLAVHAKEGETKIADAATCQARYERIFNARVLDAVRKQNFDDLFANWRGVMIGDGELWFSGVCEDRECKRKAIKIISVNQ